MFEIERRQDIIIIFEQMNYKRKNNHYNYKQF